MNQIKIWTSIDDEEVYADITVNSNRETVAVTSQALAAIAKFLHRTNGKYETVYGTLKFEKND